MLQPESRAKSSQLIESSGVSGPKRFVYHHRVFLTFIDQRIVFSSDLKTATLTTRRTTPCVCHKSYAIAQDDEPIDDRVTTIYFCTCLACFCDQRPWKGDLALEARTATQCSLLVLTGLSFPIPATDKQVLTGALWRNVLRGELDLHEQFFLQERQVCTIQRLGEILRNADREDVRGGLVSVCLGGRGPKALLSIYHRKCSAGCHIVRKIDYRRQSGAWLAAFPSPFFAPS